ncbi:MAG: methyltransferase domain-containing protein [Polyangiaceae bacterium]|nr:methyltransferase domain-containing protein [Polyangiaceae bacterium]
MSEQHELDDEAPPDIPDISSDPAPPRVDEPADDEPDPYDIEVEQDEIDITRDEIDVQVSGSDAAPPPPPLALESPGASPDEDDDDAEVIEPEPMSDAPAALAAKSANEEAPGSSIRPPPSADPIEVPTAEALAPPRPPSLDPPVRAGSEPPRAGSEPPRAKSEPPRAKSEPPRASAGSVPPRPVSAPPRPAYVPPELPRPPSISPRRTEESPWPPLTNDAPPQESSAAPRTEPAKEPPPSEAATSYPPPPMARPAFADSDEPPRSVVKAARMIKARPAADAPEARASLAREAEQDAPVFFEDEPTPVSPPPPRTAPAAMPSATEELTEEDIATDGERRSVSSAEELTDDDIAPESDEEIVVDTEDEPPPTAPADSSQPAAAESAAAQPLAPDGAVVSEAGGPKPPPPPRRSAFDDARKAAQQKADARRLADEARRAAGEDPSRRGRRAWWEEIFGEDYARAADVLSEPQIAREVDFIEESLGVAKGGVVLDLACGAGHHAVELAARGYGVVGYDLSLYQLALAADVAQQQSQKLNLLQGDMREMAFEEMFDGVFCWNTSFGYFEEEKNANVAQRVFRALRPGGMFLLDVVNRDFVAEHQPSQTWFEGDACVCMDDMNVDFITSRMRVKRSLILDDGRSMECAFSVRLYGLHELGKLLHDVGFRVTEASGHPSTPGVFFGATSPRIIILAQRP